MSKARAKANPSVNAPGKDLGDHGRGSEPGQEQLHPRLDRQNTYRGNGSRGKAVNQGRAGSGPRHDPRGAGSRRSRSR